MLLNQGVDRLVPETPSQIRSEELSGQSLRDVPTQSQLERAVLPRIRWVPGSPGRVPTSIEKPHGTSTMWVTLSPAPTESSMAPGGEEEAVTLQRQYNARRMMTIKTLLSQILWWI